MLVTVMMECLTLSYPWIQRHATVLAGLCFVHERRGMAVCASLRVQTDVFCKTCCTACVWNIPHNFTFKFEPSGELQIRISAYYYTTPPPFADRTMQTPQPSYSQLTSQPCGKEYDLGTGIWIHTAVIGQHGAGFLRMDPVIEVRVAPNCTAAGVLRLILRDM